MKRPGAAGRTLIRFLLSLLVSLAVCVKIHKYFIANQQMAAAVMCKERIHYMSLAMQMYCQDYDEKLPVASRWMDSIQKYILRVPHDKYAPRFDNQTVFRCPEIAGSMPPAYGYAFNQTLSASSLRQWPESSAIPLIYDSANVDRNAADAYLSLPVPARHERWDPAQAFNYVGYLDGHIGIIRKK